MAHGGGSAVAEGQGGATLVFLPAEVVWFVSFFCKVVLKHTLLIEFSVFFFAEVVKTPFKLDLDSKGAKRHFKTPLSSILFAFCPKWC